mmetsp:Transcript_8989/g.26863  ORF Transcript_8989/g.26863 Transcript_8989/m.26863 type:complete len:81 (+) Transcript_8989:118-360(+)
MRCPRVGSEDDHRRLLERFASDGNGSSSRIAAEDCAEADHRRKRKGSNFDEVIHGGIPSEISNVAHSISKQEIVEMKMHA